MFVPCDGCLEGENVDCPLYICETEDGFFFISCIVFALIEMDAYILQRVALDFGGGDGEMPNM